MNFESIPVIDTHAHPFPPDQGAISWGYLRDAMSISFRTTSTRDNDSMLLVRMLKKQLARLLGCPAEPEAIMEARNVLASDPKSYHQLLWSDAQISTVLVDPGFSSQLIKTEAFSVVVPCPVYEGYRIEQFSKGTTRELPFDYDAFPSFGDMVWAFRAHLDAEASKPEFRFYKSIIAKRTGLKLTVPTEAETMAAWKERPEYGAPGEKMLRDFLFHQTAMKALEHDVPFQVHTGHGALDLPWAETNPIEMTHFLNTPMMDQVRFVLVHGGYPFNTEAGYMTSVYPNVFLDFSLMIPWSSIGIARRIEQTLESAPTSKLMYGSDGIMVPELFWISALNARKALGNVLNGLINDDVIDASEATDIAESVLYRTAQRVYDLDDEESSAAMESPEPTSVQ